MQDYFKRINRREFLRLMGSAATLAAIRPGWSKDESASLHGKSVHPPARHVILISLDTARADFLGCYGNTFIHTPNIDHLAKESILFSDCMTVVPNTLASHTSLFTGKYPHNHGTPRNGFIVNKENVMLTEVLKAAGFHTAGFLGSFALESRFEFSKGFDHYDENFDQFIGVDGVQQNQRTAQSVTDAVIGYLEDAGVPDNLFLFAHYFDPHRPYSPPVKYCRMYERNTAYRSWLGETQADPLAEDDFTKAYCYAGEITYTDEHIGRLIDYFIKKNILDKAILIITSDHGENFKEHFANWNHGFTVYQTTMQSICIIRLPWAARASTRIDQLFSNIDILPTLLGYLGLDSPGGIDGEAIDLNPEGKEICVSARVRFGEASKSQKGVETDPRWYNNRKSRCIRFGNLKYIYTPYLGSEELYELTADPYEQSNLLVGQSSPYLAKARALREKLLSWTNSANPLATHFESGQREETIKRLKSLGYLK